MKQQKVLIAIPTLGHIHTLTVAIMMKWLTEAFYNKDKGVMFYPTLSVKPVDRARNHIVDIFLTTDCTHLFFIDDDTVPPPDALDKLLAHDKDIVSGITPIIEHDATRENDSNGFYKKWNCVDDKDQHVKPNTGLVPIKGAGSSCILIKREVFEKLQKPCYRFLDKDDTGKPVEVTEDIYFVITSLAKGFKAFADTSVICQHEKSILW